MRQAVLFLPREGEKLPTSDELRSAGFIVSSAMAGSGEIKTTEQNLSVGTKEETVPPPIPQKRKEAAENI